MASYTSPSSDYMETEENIALLPPDLWSRDYLILGPGVLSAATRANPVRVAQIFAVSTSSQNSNSNTNTETPSLAPTSFARPVPPRISPYDGTPANLRPFCSQLINQIQESEGLFSSEMSKVRFAYQCLGPGAVTKMRSCFRCLEDPTVDPEITTLAQFIRMLKQNCDDPARLDNASRITETLYQGSMSFHEFITIFEDNMADSTYADLDKSQWKAMLKRRLSSDLRRALVSAYDVPTDYHAFVGYLRVLDAELQSIRASRRISSGKDQAPVPRVSVPTLRSIPAPELTVSQGGSAMDLDILSREKSADGRLTLAAKDARRKLGRCIRCNTPGHIVRNCPLGNQSTSIATAEISNQEKVEELKE